MIHNSSTLSFGKRKSKRLVLSSVAAAVLSVASPQVAQADAEAGEWGPVMEWTLIPLHAMLMPDGKVFSFGTDERGTQGGNFIYNIFDPLTNQNNILPNTTGVNTFCSNMAVDPGSGDILIAGGDNYRYGGTQWSGHQDVIKFNYISQSVRDSETGGMSYGRWYGTMITLHNGQILSVGGRNERRDASTIPEIYNTQNGYRELPGANIPGLDDAEGSLRGAYYYVYAWQTSNEDVVVIAAEDEFRQSAIYRMDVEGQGSVERVGFLPFETRNLSPGIMYDVDKVLMTDEDAWVWSGDLSTSTPTWERLFRIFDENNANDDTARTNGTFAALPDGTIALIGGSESNGLLADSVSGGQESILIWDPKKPNEYKLTARSAMTRMYHSVGITLADGRVFTGGGGSPGPYNHDNAEIFSPAYLYKDGGGLAERPIIYSSPKNITAGSMFEINVDDAASIQKVTISKVSSATHARTADARIFHLDYTSIDNNTLSLSTPGSSILTPGVWLLSTVDSDGVPSVSKIVGINMVDIESVDGLDENLTVVYNVEDEQIDGAVDITVQARFDDVTGRSNQRIFEFGNDDLSDSIYFGQIGNSADVVFGVYVEDAQYEVVATNTIEEGVVADWQVSVEPDGAMKIYKNGVMIAEADGEIPRDVQRVSYLYGRSGIEGNEQLAGLVRDLVIVNNEDEPPPPAINRMPMVDVELSILTRDIFEDSSEPTGSTAAYTASGTIAFIDMDLTDIHTATFAPAVEGYAGEFVISEPTTTESTNNGSVDWSFSVGNHEIDRLAAGENFAQRYSVTIVDNRGAMSVAEVVVSLVGSTDAPILIEAQSSLSGSINALSAADEGDGVATLTTGGAISFEDVDIIDEHDAIVQPASPENLGSLVVDSELQGAFEWKFSVSDAALDVLGSQSIEQTYTVVVSDRNGGTLDVPIVVELDGSMGVIPNSAPVIDINLADLQASVDELPSSESTEDGELLATRGSIVFTDVDVEDIHTVEFTEGGADYVGVFQFDAPTESSDPGSASWTFRVADADVDYLAQDEQLVQVYNVTLSDGDGGSDSTSITITINGAADEIVAIDTDGDGVVDTLDAFPNDPREWLDSDGDGVGDNADSTPFGETDVDNLLSNADFENGLASWQACGGQASVSPNSTNGSPVLSLSGAGCVFQEFTFTPSVDYSLSCTARSPSSVFTSMTLSFSDASFQTLVGPEVAVTRDANLVYLSTVSSPAEAVNGVVTLYSDNGGRFSDCALVEGSSPIASIDTDGDGVPDIQDQYPDDPNESADTDGDGVGDNADVFPNDATETADTDNDGIGDNADPTPNGESSGENLLADGSFDEAITGWLSCGGEQALSDAGANNTSGLSVSNNGCSYAEIRIEAGKTYVGSCEANNGSADFANLTFTIADQSFQPLVADSVQLQGTGFSGYELQATAPEDSVYATLTAYANIEAVFDNCLIAEFIGEGSIDTDGDGVADNEDAFPSDPTESADSDGDGIGDNADSDLTRNGSFTNGLTNWISCGGAPELTQNGVDGSAAVTLANQSCLYQEILVTPEAGYQLTCSALSTAPYTSVSLAMTDASYNVLTASELPVVGARFTEYQTQLNAALDAKYGVVIAYADTNGIFDNCNISKVAALAEEPVFSAARTVETLSFVNGRLTTETGSSDSVLRIGTGSAGVSLLGLTLLVGLRRRRPLWTIRESRM